MGKEAYLKKMFQAYYSHGGLGTPSFFNNREFAFVQWGKRGMFRHRAFETDVDYWRYMEKFAPQHAYVSAALYQKPDNLDMDEKGWLGCDLIFDIDCDHIPTSCKERHDSWTCKQCGASGRGEHPPICPRCQYPRFDSFAWVCDECLEVSKEETIKLCEDFLVPDLGLSPSEIRLVFSGHRGYHAHVELEDYRRMNQEERRELVDYIRGTGISLNVLGFRKMSKETIGFSKETPGWAGKIAKFLEGFFLHITEDTLLDELKFTRQRASSVIAGIPEILERIQSGNQNWTVKGISHDAMREIVEYAATKIAPDIDIPVSLDTHRLIRLEDSLHGKTGFRVVPLRANEIDEFDPFKDPLVFGDTPTEVEFTRDCPEFRVGDEVFDGFDAHSVVELPASAAVFVLCKGVANIT
ncbi:MAG: DNA primase small subunit domain-containing protein [Promethearchaeota archaeon]